MVRLVGSAVSSFEDRFCRTTTERLSARRGQGYTLRVSAVPSVHRGRLARCQPLDGARGAPAQCSARRAYERAESQQC